MHFLIGTSGHVDHGKTALIRALTGIETDRLREEKERGLSIVPGFAFLDLPDIGHGARRVGIVDVPGHERFLKNTLTGLSGVDVALLVVAADEGVSVQTREHARALKLGRVPQVLGVLSKRDAVEDEFLELARADLREFLDASGWAQSPIVAVSARQELGLEELKAHIARACDDLEEQRSHQSKSEKPFRISIDRAFSIAGRGTIVTGSVAQGRVEAEDPLEMLLPGGQVSRVRVRSLESHGQEVQVLERGQRGALNLAGVGVDEVLSGAILSTPGFLLPGASWVAWVEVADDAARGLKRNSVLRLHAGTAEVGAHLNLFQNEMQPGQSGVARLRLDKPLAGAIGDRFILREVSSEHIVGGGLLLNPEDSRTWNPVSKAFVLRQVLELERSPESLLIVLLRSAERAGLRLDDLRRALQLLDVEPLLQVLEASGQIIWRGSHLWRREDFEAAGQVLGLQLQEAHARHPSLEAVPLSELGHDASPELRSAVLEEGARRGAWSIENSLIRHASHQVQRDEVREALEHADAEAHWKLLSPEELILAVEPSRRERARSILSAWLRSGEWTRVGSFVTSRARMEAGAATLEEAFGGASTCSVGAAGAAFGVSRKWALPLLEWFDKNGWTRREGESRVRGPRLQLKAPAEAPDE